jgi:hypothetical protein
MMRPPDKRNPADGVGRARKTVHLDGLNDMENNPPTIKLQALRIVHRFGLSLPVAHRVAELHYSGGRPQ